MLGVILFASSALSLDANQATRWRFCAVVAVILDAVIIQPALEAVFFRCRNYPDPKALERARVHAELGAVMQRL